ncbi:hypothetical protein PRIPAC_79490 [Pristionchus pacificus]|uniref:Cytochrome P450 n=1 Tax=Pristionchus pacificus TaxID=54126 RepID=A0A454XVX9_PRIPA|nr:hypothetical protein PRIPAC_79490 [Pristionchus pacificus]|eukprot:PDM78918.1 cytochrome P450 [Pristionchus pacificus]
MIGAILLVASLYYAPWIIRTLRKWIYQYPYVVKLPGPKGLPLLGNMLDLAGDSTAPMKFWSKEAEKARAKGDGVFCMTLFGRVMTFPLNGEAVKSICESTEELTKGKDYDFLHPWMGKGIVFAIGQAWRDRRKSYTPIFHNRTMLEGYVDYFNKHARVTVEILGEVKPGSTIDINMMLKRYSLDAICESSLGFTFNVQRNPEHPYILSVDKFAYYLQRWTNEPQMWITWIWYALYHYTGYKDCLDTMNRLTQEVLDNRMAAVKRGEVDLDAEKRPLIDHFIAQYEKGDWTYEELHLECNSAIFGGHDSTSCTLTWVYWALATQPEFQQQCYEEIYGIFGDSDRDCTHDDMNAMKFTERFIKETMRIFPPVPLIERELGADFQMGKYLLPKGSEIFIAPHLVHHNPEVYPDPFTFDPDRFLPENIAKRSPYDFLPFSAGPRNCLGQKFALHEMKTIVSWTLRYFSFHTDRKLLDQEMRIEVVTKTSLGCHLQVTPRKVKK